MHPDIQNNLKIRPAHIASFIVFLLGRVDLCGIKNKQHEDKV